MCLPASVGKRSYRLLRIHLRTPVRRCRDLSHVRLKPSGFRLSSHWDSRLHLKSCWLDSSHIGIGLSTCCHHHNLPLWIIMAEKQGSLWASTALPCRTALLLFFLVWNSEGHKEQSCWTRVLWWSSLGSVGHWWSWRWPTMSTGKLYSGVFFFFSVKLTQLLTTLGGLQNKGEHLV